MNAESRFEMRLPRWAKAMWVKAAAKSKSKLTAWVMEACFKQASIDLRVTPEEFKAEWDKKLSNMDW